MRLFPRDRDRVLAMLPELYRYAPPIQFFKTSGHLLQQLIASDHAGWFASDYGERVVRVRMVVESERRMTARLIDLCEQALPSHPFIEFSSVPNEVMLLSDVGRRSRAAHRSRFEEVYRVLDVGDQLTLRLVQSEQPAVTALTFNRRTRNFAERDRSVLKVLLPHLQRAYANSQLVERGEDRNQVRQACEEGFGLTGREAVIASWMAQGKTNAEIAMILASATRTVEKHVERVLAKLGVENRAAAAAQIHGWSRSRLMPVPAVRSDLTTLDVFA
jgi:DNA-binding CsgD family transcriptional regulator